MRDEVLRAVAQWRPTAGARVRRSRYATSAGIYNVHLPGGERAVYKRSGASVRPDFLCLEGREAAIYRSGLPAAADPPALLAAGRGWLLLEWCGSVDLGQVGDRGVWREAARRLGELHAWGRSRIDAVPAALRWDEPELHLRWGRRAQRFGHDPQLEPLWRRYSEVAGRLAALPKTVVHGDCNASNVLVVRRPGARTRIRFLDWESAGIGPGLLDLAALVSGGWSEPERESLIDAYGPVDREALLLCRLALAVQWLGWSEGWTPPPRLTHDWRGEALAHARELGVIDRAA